MKTLIPRLLRSLHLRGGNWNDMEAVGVCSSTGVSYPAWRHGGFGLPVSSHGERRCGRNSPRSYSICPALSYRVGDALTTPYNQLRGTERLWSSFLATRLPPLTGVKLSLHPVARQLRSQRKMHCRSNYMRTGLENPIMFALLITSPNCTK